MFSINVGTADRIFRVFMGIVLILLGLFILDGVAEIVTLTVAAVAFFTSATSNCLLYSMLGIKTCSTLPKEGKE
jgi:hypothetical protein